MSTTKADLVRHIADSTGIKKIQAEKVVDTFTGSIKSALIRGDRVTLVGFGSFAIATRAERKGRNPRTKELMTVPSSSTIRFRSSKDLRSAVS